MEGDIDVNGILYVSLWLSLGLNTTAECSVAYSRLFIAHTMFWV